ncbi:hypothetical protein NIES4101_46050 [Calothrix sp. NIES-4101]|nr:hypothetical protein NIES4101_46050 [Calothrix sp. NIES-4101]
MEISDRINSSYTHGCHLCGSETWIDEDLHWVWCHNPKCRENWNNREKQKDFQEAVNDLEEARKSCGNYYEEHTY